MKKITLIPIIFFLLAIPILSYTGGEEIIIYSDDCSIAYVNITGTERIDKGEFSLSDNCVFNEEWVYNCTCEKDIILTTKVNAYNKYTIITDIWKEVVENPEENINTIITNPSDENITNTITLPNNIKINRIIQPNEILEYVKLPTNEIIIPDSNVSLDEVKKENNIIEIKATSSGTKCFDIYSDSEPYEILINNISNAFAYNDKVIYFCTTFSTKTIKIDYTFPSAVSSGGSGGGRGGKTTTPIQGEGLIGERLKLETPTIEEETTTPEIIEETIPTEGMGGITGAVIGTLKNNTEKVVIIFLAVIVIGLIWQGSSYIKKKKGIYF